MSAHNCGFRCLSAKFMCKLQYLKYPHWIDLHKACHREKTPIYRGRIECFRMETSTLSCSGNVQAGARKERCIGRNKICGAPPLCETQTSSSKRPLQDIPDWDPVREPPSELKCRANAITLGRLCCGLWARWIRRVAKSSLWSPGWRWGWGRRCRFGRRFKCRGITPPPPFFFSPPPPLRVAAPLSNDIAGTAPFSACQENSTRSGLGTLACIMSARTGRYRTMACFMR